MFLLQKANLKQPLRLSSNTELDQMKIRYYSPDVHVASFVLPYHMKKVGLFSMF
jgi:spermidine synthase